MARLQAVSTSTASSRRSRRPARGAVFAALPLLLAALPILSGGGAAAQILFEASFEDGVVPYLGPENAHPGGGYIVWLGGNIGGAPGDGTQDPNLFHNVVLSDEAHARGAVPGSVFALKTHYAAGEQGGGRGHSNSFQKNTTIIRFPEVNSGEIYISWYQKWHPDWRWPSDHQKMCKLRNNRSSQQPSQNLGTMQSNDQPNVGPATTTVNYGGSSATGFRRVFSNLFDWVPSFPGNIEDDYDNGLGPGGEDINFHPDLGRWYRFQVMMRFDSSPGAGDGEYRLWLDEDLYTYITNADIRPVGDPTGVNSVELQHVRETAEINEVDMPTYMDDIIISRQFIPPSAARIFSDGFESGDLSEWSSTN